MIVTNERKTRLCIAAAAQLLNMPHILSDSIAVAYQEAEQKYSSSRFYKPDDEGTTYNAVKELLVNGPVVRSGRYPRFRSDITWFRVFEKLKLKHTDLIDIWKDLNYDPYPPIPAKWLNWNDGTVKKLAHAIYEENTFGILPVVADALEEAGCTDTELLNHARSNKPHYRGCWLIDTILGKK